MLKRLIQKLFTRNIATVEALQYEDESACALEALASSEVRYLYTCLGTDTEDVKGRVRRIQVEGRIENVQKPLAIDANWLRHMESLTPQIPMSLQLLVRLCVHGSTEIRQALSPSDGLPGDVSFFLAHKKTEAEARSLWPAFKDRTGNVLLLNDHFTPMELVVSVLEGPLGLTRELAIKTMLDVHSKGVAVIAGKKDRDVEAICTELNLEWRGKGLSLYCLPE